MKIFSAAQVRDWDAYTILHEPVSSIELMERAAEKCFRWLAKKYPGNNTFLLFCGTGNNGGDGLALARMLHNAKHTVRVFILSGANKSPDFINNLERLATLKIVPHFITENSFPPIPSNSIVIDALFGTGLSRPLEGIPAGLVKYINQSAKKVISIDLPSGLMADSTSVSNTVVKASYTLSFQSAKLAFMMAENESFIGETILLDIGLHQQFYETTAATFSIIDENIIHSIYKPRKQFSHKYSYGHALLYTGSKDMMGAAILSAKACLRSGAGLVTVHTETSTQTVMQAALPEAITSTENDWQKLSVKKNVIAIGPGIDYTATNSGLLKNILHEWKGYLVIDATALTLLAAFSPSLLQVHQAAILTPHAGEFERLFGKTANDFERARLALHKAATLNCYIILKGHHSFIACPDGKGFFNSTGNAGMATAGSGDVLTGMIAGLLAQGYEQHEACLLAVYLHGAAGDIAAEKSSQESMIAGDIIDCLGQAFKKITNITL